MSPSLLSSFQERITQAAAAKQVLRIQGGNTKHFYGSTRADHAVLDLSPYQGVVSYEPSELVVTARAGTPLQSLASLLAGQGQCLAFEPPHFGAAATVGGMVAAGLAGPARASAGAVRDHVLGVKLLNGLAQELTFGGQVMKNVAGYDVSRFMAGSMGCLGVITEVSLKVLPQAPSQATMVCSLSQEKALNLLHRWGGQALPLHASLWVQDDAATPQQGHLWVRWQGAVAAVQAASERMRVDVKTLGAQAQAMDHPEALAHWQAVREHTLAFFSSPAANLCLWRLSVPQTAPVLSLPQPQCVEWHGGLRWLWAPATEAMRLRQIAAQAGGHATLFRHAADGSSQSTPVFTPLSEGQRRLQQALQQQFDPHAVFKTERIGI